MNLSTVIAALVSTARSGIATAALPLLVSFFSNVTKDPSAVNVALQLVSLQAQLAAALPTIEKDVMANLAQLIQTELTSIATQGSQPVPVKTS